ncbi:response regulator [Sphaerothrix gracilis]|uniref:response regulator n=1 Tax=Sphaerothrix gracilis TaxID=3151835 RepID=UPI0031FBE5A7
MRSECLVSTSDDCSALAGIRILAIDSDPDSLLLLQTVFEQYGCTEIIVVTTAQEALEILEQIQPDILISELRLIDTNGCTLIRQIKRKLKLSIPAIALTASAWPRDRNQAIAAGFCCHIAKPFNFDELISNIVSLTRRRTL